MTRPGNPVFGGAILTALLAVTPAGVARAADLADVQRWEAGRNADALIRDGLGDLNPQIRKASADALTRLGVPLGALLLGSLGGNPDARDGLTRAKDPRALAPLLSVLHVFDRTVQGAAADTLSALGDPRAVPPLLDLLRQTTVSSRVEAAARVLGTLRDPRAVDPLISVLRHSSTFARAAAATALGRLGDRRAVDPLVTAMQDDNDAVRRAAGAALGDLGEGFGRLLLDALEGSKTARDALVASHDPRSLPPLITALKDERLRWGASAAIAALRDERAIAPLVHALADNDADLRAVAAWTLFELADPRAVDGLLVAARDRDPIVREASTWALSKLEDPRVVEAMTVALADDDARVRRAAAWALAKARDRRSYDAVARASADGDLEVRRVALQTLGGLGDARAFDGLVGALGDPDRSIRMTASEALGALGDRRAVAPLLAALDATDARDAGEREAAAAALAALGEPLGRSLLAALGGSSPDADALARARDARAVTLLVGALDSAVPATRRTAARLLGQIGDPRAVDGLTAMARRLNPRDRLTASAALLSIPGLGVAQLLRAAAAVVVAPASLVYLVPVLLAIVAAIALVPRGRAARSR